jgi:AraC-like DNA-binding protein
MRISIKNMVCPRCIMAVTELLTSLGYKPSDVELGYADIDCVDISKEDWNVLSERLSDIGFELLSDNDVVTVERIKIAILSFARLDGGLKHKLSQMLEEKLGQPYKSLTAIFSKTEGRTIENYFINQRIEYVKELISYGDLTLTDIAFKTGYSSVAYLSKQFAQIVGMTISEFRLLASNMRNSLTDI